MNHDREATKVIFGSLLSRAISPWMRSHGYSRKGQTFVSWQNKTCASIRFQTSKWSEPSLYEFTVNIGVFSAIVFEFENEKTPVPRFPNEGYCHWRARLGELSPLGRDVWWSFRDSLEAERVWDEIAGLLDTYALPLLRERATDAGFRDFLLQQWQRNPESVFAMKTLVVVLREMGPEHLFRQVHEAYGKAVLGDPHATLARAWFKKLAEKK